MSLPADLELGLKLPRADCKPAVSDCSHLTMLNMRWLTSRMMLVTAQTCGGVPTCWGVHLHLSSFSAAGHVWGTRVGLQGGTRVAALVIEFAE